MMVVMGSRPPFAGVRTVFLGAWVLLLSACGGDNGNASNGQDCLVNSDCPPGQVCSLGTCTSATGPRDAATPFPRLDAGPGPVDGGPCSSALTCDAAGAECGMLEDGCGAFLDCGGCLGGQTCGGGGTPNRCGDGICTPASCESLGAQCGDLGDGCSGMLECGTCPEGRFCNGNTCLCTPKTCEDLNANCGEPDDGCGTPLSCGVCQAPDRCGANEPYQCGCKLETPKKTGFLPFRSVRQVNPGPAFVAWEGVNNATGRDADGATVRVRGTCRKIEEHGSGCRCCAAATSTTKTSWDLQLSNTDLAGKVPEGAIILGVEVSLRALRSGTAELVNIALTGADWNSAPRTRAIQLGTSYQDFVFGGPNDLWGRKWTAADFDDPMFRLHVRMSATGICHSRASSCLASTASVDVARILVHYQVCR